MKKMTKFSRKGSIETSELVWWLVAAAVLVILVIALVMAFGSGKGGLDYINDLLRFGR